MTDVHLMYIRSQIEVWRQREEQELKRLGLKRNTGRKFGEVAHLDGIKNVAPAGASHHMIALEREFLGLHVGETKDHSCIASC